MARAPLLIAVGVVPPVWMVLWRRRRRTKPVEAAERRAPDPR